MKLKLLLLLALFSLKMRAQVVADVAQYVPLAATVGLDFCGVEAKHTLDAKIYAVPALSRGRLIVRTGADELICLEAGQ